MATIFIGMGKPTFPIPFHFIALGEELARRGHQVHLLMHHPHRIEESRGNPAIHYWPFYYGPKRIWKDLTLLIPMLRTLHPVCVIAGHRDTTMLCLAGWLCKIPIRVWYYHTLSTQVNIISDYSPLRRGIRRLIRVPIYNLIITNFIGVSNAAQYDISKTYKVPTHKIQILYNSLDDPLSTSEITQKINGRPEERIVCVGRIDSSKGQDILIRAVVELQNDFPNVRVFFIGDGKDKERFAALAQQLGVEKKCVFIGTVAHADVLSWMHSASCTIVPSRMDNLPTTVIESMAVGTPVIATNVGGIPEILGRDGGILVSPDNPQELSAAIERLLRDDSLRSYLGGKARQRFLECFERSRIIPKQADFIEGLLGKGGGEYARS